MKVVEKTKENGVETTKDKLLGGRVLLLQPKRGYRAALDSVLLASAIPAVDGDSVMDLGSGVGSASLCLAYRVKGCQIEGIEVQRPLVSLGTQNISLNGFEERIKFVLGDVSEVGKVWERRFDHVMINPPYLPVARAQPTSMWRSPARRVLQALTTCVRSRPSRAWRSSLAITRTSPRTRGMRLRRCSSCSRRVPECRASSFSTATTFRQASR